MGRDLTTYIRKNVEYKRHSASAARLGGKERHISAFVRGFRSFSGGGARVGGFVHACRPRYPRRAASRNGRPQLSCAVPVPHDARPLSRGAAHLLLIRVPSLSQLSPSRSLPSSSAGWQRDNIVVSLRFEYTDAEYNAANSSMLAAIILTFICLAVQVRKWRPGDPPPPPARPPARPLCSA